MNNFLIAAVYDTRYYSLIEVLTEDLMPNTLFPIITILFISLLIIFLMINHLKKEENTETTKEIKKIKEEITKICWPQWNESENHISDINSLNKEE